MLSPMVWALLAALGVALWLCAAGILILIWRNRTLPKRPGSVPVRIRGANKERWSPGHGVWVHDVFAFRGLPAAWAEALVWATEASARLASAEERKKLHRIGHQPIVVTLTLTEGGTIDLATRPECKRDLLTVRAGREFPRRGPVRLANRARLALLPDLVQYARAQISLAHERDPVARGSEGDGFRGVVDRHQ